MVNDVVVSLLPDGSDIVSVNSVNDDLNSHFYLDNDTNIKPKVAPSQLNKLVEYDAMTVKLRGHVLLQPGKTYRIRMVIANVSDEILDSALIIQKNSVKSIQPQP